MALGVFGLLMSLLPSEITISVGLSAGSSLRLTSLNAGITMMDLGNSEHLAMTESSIP